MSEQVTCAGCGDAFPEDRLNFSDRGSVCDACLVDVQIEAETPRGLRGAWSSAGLSVLLSALGTCVSIRDTQTNSFQVAGHGSETTWVSADLPGLIFGGLGLLAAVYGFGRLRVQPTRDDAAFGAKRLAAAALLGLLTLVAAWVLWDAFPHKVTREW